MSGQSVELGFVEKCEPWEIESCQFPSKLGGKPAWLDLKNLPTTEDLKCGKCQNQMIFLCQIYAPCDEKEENFVENFHRTIFIFVCTNGKCCERNNSENIKAFRSSLSKQNKFYPEQPPEYKPDGNVCINKLVNLCRLCGAFAEKICSQCKQTYYCCRQHQVLDWKEGHKTECNNSDVTRQSKLLFSEWEIVTEPEEVDNKSIDFEEELKKLGYLQIQGQAGTMSDIPESDLDIYAESVKDKAFHKFKKRIDHDPDQVIRYKKGGTPLWIAKDPVPENIPSCQYCGSERQFEFQIMPQMLSLFTGIELDWGIIAVYTCQNNCVKFGGYREEFVFKQDVDINVI